MSVTPRKDTALGSDLIEFLTAEAQQLKEKPPTYLPTIEEIRTDEVGLDLWTFERDSKTSIWDISGIYRSGIFAYLESKQFAKRFRPDQNSTLLVRGQSIIEPVIDTVMRDCVKAHIEANPGSLSVGYLEATYEGRLEIYNRQQHLVINPRNLEGLRTHERPLLRDTATSAFIPYRNGIVEVTAQRVTLHSYTLLDEKCVWKAR